MSKKLTDLPMIDKHQYRSMSEAEIAARVQADKKAIEVIDQLRAELAAVTKERDELHMTLRYERENPVFDGRLNTWQAVAGKYRGENKELQYKLATETAAVTKERDALAESEKCWIHNAKELQKGYNELDVRLRAETARADKLQAALDGMELYGYIHKPTGAFVDVNLEDFAPELLFPLYRKPEIKE